MQLVQPGSDIVNIYFKLMESFLSPVLGSEALSFTPQKHLGATAWREEDFNSFLKNHHWITVTMIKTTGSDVAADFCLFICLFWRGNY